MKSIILNKAAKKIVVLVALIVCLLYLRHPPQAFASACQDACYATYSACVTNCEENAPVVGFCEQICNDNLALCLGRCH